MRLIQSVIRVASAVAVGLVLGAPLAALAVNESIFIEAIKVGIETALAAMGSEITNFFIGDPKSEPEGPRRIVGDPRKIDTDPKPSLLREILMSPPEPDVGLEGNTVATPGDRGPGSVSV